jgi:uncharacterized protein YycO
MKKNMALLDLAPGDRIIIPKSEFMIVQHHGIYLGKNNSGADLVAENKIGYGVRVVSLTEFFSGVSTITRIEKFEGTNYERRRLVERIVSKLGHPYDLINYNCQHFANDMLNNEIKSDQVDNLLEGLKIAAGIVLTIGFLSVIAGK